MIPGRETFTCDLCPLGERVNPNTGEPYHVVPGEGPEDARVMIVGMNPGHREEIMLRPFIGKSGMKLNKVLRLAGIDRTKCYVTNVVKHALPSGRDNLHVGEIEACSIYIEEELKTVDPDIIIALGGPAIEYFLGSSGVEDQHGRPVELDDGTILFPTFHPASTMYNSKYEKAFIEDIKKAGRLIRGELDMDQTEFTVIETLEDLEQFNDHLADTGCFAFDIETTGLCAECDEITDIVFSAKEGTAFVLPLKEFKEGKLVDAVDQDLVDEIFKRYFADTNIGKITHNGLFDWKFLLAKDLVDYEEVEGGWVFDTLYAHHSIINEYSPHGLKYLAGTFTSMMAWDRDVVDSEDPIAMLPASQRAKYAAGDGDATWRLFEKFLSMAEERPQQFKLYQEIVQPAMPVYVEMIVTGINVDKDRLDELRREYKAAKRGVEKKIHKMVGREFNVNSDDQFVEAAREDLGIKYPGPDESNGFFWTPSKSRPSNAEPVRDAMRERQPHEVWDLIDKYKGYSHQISSFVGDPEKHKDANCSNKDKSSILRNICETTGRIYPSILPHGTKTGRRSYRSPNLQQQTKRGEGEQLRSVFVPDEGNVFLTADYDRAEFFVAAHLSGDELMIKNVEKDFHTLTAALIFGKKEVDVTEEERFLAKSCGFGSMYGGTAKTLASQAKISIDRAQEAIDSFYSVYKTYKEWQFDLIRKVKKQGYITGICGRKRHIEWPEGRRAQAHAKNQIMNFPMQNAVAELVLMALPEVRDVLRSYKGRLVVEVHDELLAESPEHNAEDALQDMMKAMSIPLPKIGKPIPVSGEIKRRWKEYE